MQSQTDLMASLIDKFKEDFSKKIGNRNILDWAKSLAAKDSSAFEVEHTGTLYKLYVLFSYVKFPYLHIMASRRKDNGTRLIFLDLYSGNGLNKINGLNEIYVCGSSILTLLASFVRTQARDYLCYFDHMVLVDNHSKSVDILNERCSTIIKELQIDKILSLGKSLSTNANIISLKADVTDQSFITELSNWINSIWENNMIHILLFIDPDAPRNFSMRTLENLLQYPGDLLMLLHPATFAEMILKDRYKVETVQNMLGVDENEANRLFEIKSSTTLSNYYVERFENVIKNTTIRKLVSGSNQRNIIIKIPIKTGSQTSYYLLYATRKTGGKDSTKWQEAFSNFASEIGKMSDVGQAALDVLQGNQSRIDHF